MLFVLYMFSDLFVSISNEVFASASIEISTGMSIEISTGSISILLEIMSQVLEMS